MTRLYFDFHPCHFEEWRKITAEDESDMPEDGAWLWWIDRKGQIEKARLKIDAEDHFHPSPKYLDEWNVIGWLGMSDVETHDDCINRQEVYKIIGKLHVGDVRFFEKLRRGLEALPPVQPDVKTIYDIGFTDGVKALAAMNELVKEERKITPIVPKVMIDEIIKKLEEGNK